MTNIPIRYFSFILLNYVVQSANGQNPQQHSVLQDSIAHVEHWTYGDNEHGPRYWPQLFPQYCAGYYQSPINIWTSDTVYHPSLKEFAIFYDPPLPGSTFEIHNNGHAVEVNTKGEFYVTNGGLQNIYRTAQFHFHWGSEDSQGSEHTINGQRFPMEMHIVNWNTKYDSPDEAVNHPDGLAVLSILFRMSQRDNPILEPIVKVLPYVRDPDQHVLITINGTSMKSFLPNYPDRYYRYHGSLTTPHCNEAVIWTIFEQQQYISERQIYYFRQMLTSSLHIDSRTQRNDREFEGRVRLVDNFRPTQPLNGRTVYRSFPYFDYRKNADAKRCYC